MKKFTATQTFDGASNQSGLSVRHYEKDTVYELPTKLAEYFVREKLGKFTPEDKAPPAPAK